MLYCLGFIPGIIRDDLRIIAKIRNIFAHSIDSTFEDEKIIKLCKDLKWHKETMGEPPAGATNRDLFQVGVNQIVTYLNGMDSMAKREKRQKPF
jgi:hypothetical protein